MSARVASALRGHLQVLAAAPRNRNADPNQLAAVRRYITETLESADWNVTEQTFTPPLGWVTTTP